MAKLGKDEKRLYPARNKQEVVSTLLSLIFFLGLLRHVTRREIQRKSATCHFSEDDCFVRFITSSFDSNETIFFVVANGGSLDLIRNFLCFYRKTGSSASVLVVSESPIIAEAVTNEFGVSSVLMTGLSMQSSDLDFGTFEYRKLIYYRTRMVALLLEQGFSVCITDADTVWLSDPIPFLDQYHNADLVGQVDDNNLCGGFLLIRNKKQEIFQFWLTVLFEYGQRWSNPDLSIESTEQGLVNELLQSNFRGLAVVKLPTDKFPSGNDYFSSRWGTATPIVIHNNYIIGNSKKIERFRAHNLWNPMCV